MNKSYGNVNEEGTLVYAESEVGIELNGKTIKVHDPSEKMYNDNGFYRVNDRHRPGCPEGHHLVPTGRWKVEDNECRRVFDVVEDEPVEPQPRRWTPLTLKRGAAVRGWWEQFRAILQSAEGYEDFLMCQYVAEDDPMFRPIYDALCGMFGKELVDAYLDELPTEG